MPDVLELNDGLFVAFDEADLAFGLDGTAYGLLRGNSRTIAMLGTGKAPYYKDWQWQEPRVDWHGNGDARPIGEVMEMRPLLRSASCAPTI